MSNGADAIRNPFDPFGQGRRPAPLDPFDRFLQQRRRARALNRQRETRFTRLAQQRIRDQALRRATEQKIAQAAERSALNAAISRAATISRATGIGGALILGAELITEAIREQQERRIADEMEAQNVNIERKIQRRAKEKELRVAGVRSPAGRLSAPGQLPDGAATPRVLPTPSTRAPQPGITIPASGSIRPDVFGFPTPDIATPPHPNPHPP